MSVDPTPEQSYERDTLVHLTLTWPEAERLRITLPWLLRALDDRETLSPRIRERRRKAHTALDQLLTAVSSQLREADPDDRARLTGAVNG
jgi:hypothetical protein